MEWILAVAIILIFAGYYTFVAYSFLRNYSTLLLSSLFFLIFFYDFIFINLSYYINSTIIYLLKSWMEYGLISLALCFFLFLAFNRFKFNLNYDVKLFYLLCIFSLWGIIVGVIGGDSLSQILLGWRSYLLPLVLFSLMSLYGLFDRVNLNRLNLVLTIYSVFSVSATFIQYFTFDKSVSELWFYRFFNSSPETSLDAGVYNFIRDNKLRATGLYVSPLINSVVLGFFSLLALSNLIYSSRITKRVLYAILLAILLWGLWLTNTRIGFFMLVISFFSALLYFRFHFTNFYLILLLPVFAIILTILSLVFGYTSDLSALGRLVQYGQFLNHFKPIGLGFGHQQVNVYYDSWYISVVLLFGYFSVFYILFLLTLIKRIYNKSPEVFFTSQNEASKAIYFTTFSFSFSLIYIFAFQYTTGGPALLLYFLLNFLVFKKLCNPKSLK